MSEPKNTPPRLTTSAILRDVTLEDLADFVAKYAAKNRQFATDLRMHFALRASNMTTDDSLEKVLIAAVKVAMKGSKRNSNVWVGYQNATTKLLQQVTTDQQSGDLSTTLRALRALLSTLPDTTQFAEPNETDRNAEMLQWTLRCSKEFSFLTQSPEAKMQILDLWQKANWLTINEYGVLIAALQEWLIPLAAALSEGRQLAETAQKQAQSHDNQALVFIAIWLSLHFGHHDITQQLEPSKHALKAALWAKKNKQIPFGLAIIQFTLLNYEHTFLQERSLRHMRYFLAENTDSPAAIQARTEESRWTCLYEHNHLGYFEYEKLTSHEAAAFLFAELDAQPETLPQLRCIADILAKRGEFDALLKRLQTSPPEVIHQYRSYLLPRFGGNLNIMYLDWLQNRLIGYIGPIPAAQVQTIIAELKIDAPEFAQSLSNQMIDNNPRRIALHNQLNELWQEDEN